MTRELPHWRSLLYVPASAEKFVAKAHERGADVVILDLEDGVAPDAKDAARAGLPASVRSVRRNGADVVVRINRPLRMAVQDIAAAVAAASGSNASYITGVALRVDGGLSEGMLNLIPGRPDKQVS